MVSTPYGVDGQLIMRSKNDCLRKKNASLSMISWRFSSLLLSQYFQLFRGVYAFSNSGIRRFGIDVLTHFLEGSIGGATNFKRAILLFWKTRAGRGRLLEGSNLNG